MRERDTWPYRETEQRGFDDAHWGRLDYDYDRYGGEQDRAYFSGQERYEEERREKRREERAEEEAEERRQERRAAERYQEEESEYQSALAQQEQHEIETMPDTPQPDEPTALSRPPSPPKGAEP